MRVSRELDRGKLTLQQEGVELFKQTKSYLAPPEMIQLKLRQNLKGLSKKPLTIGIRKEA